MGLGEKASKVYIIDYGLAKRYRSRKTFVHIPMKQGKKLIGTSRYSSLNTHMGIEQSRRDDLECLGYSLLYLLHGGLPWQGLRIDNKKEKYSKVRDMKLATGIEVLCHNLPIEFARYMYYCRELKFESKPDYKQLRSQFRDCFLRLYGDREICFDWQQSSKPLEKGETNDTRPGSPAPDEPKKDPAKPITEEKIVPTADPERRDSQGFSAKADCVRGSSCLGQSSAEAGNVPKERASAAEADSGDKVGDSKNEAGKPQQTKEGEVEARSAPAVSLIVTDPNNNVKVALRLNLHGTKGEEKVAPPPEKLLGKETPTPIELQLTDRSSCNLNTPEITEFHTLFGKASISDPVDESIPTENPTRMFLKVPQCTYIENSRHWQRYKSIRHHEPLRKVRTGQSRVLEVPPGNCDIRTQGTGQSGDANAVPDAKLKSILFPPVNLNIID